MHLAEYTPDAICRALGLSAFQLDSKASWQARLLLKPSFDPELCITLAGRDDGCFAELRASEAHLWALGGWRGAQERFALEEVPAPCEMVEQLLEQIDPPDQGRTVTIDGMPFNLIVRTSARSFSRAAEASTDQVLRVTLPGLLVALHSAARVPSCILSIARVAKYVGTRLEAPTTSDGSRTLSVAVFGDASDRGELRAAVQRHTKSRG